MTQHENQNQQTIPASPTATHGGVGVAPALFPSSHDAAAPRALSRWHGSAALSWLIHLARRQRQSDEKTLPSCSLLVGDSSRARQLSSRPPRDATVEVTGWRSGLSPASPPNLDGD